MDFEQVAAAAAFVDAFVDFEFGAARFGDAALNRKRMEAVRRLFGFVVCAQGQREDFWIGSGMWKPES